MACGAAMACGADHDRQRLRDIFQQLDRDRTGTISHDQLARLVRLFTNFDDTSVERLLSKLQWSHDKRVQLDDLIDWFARPAANSGNSDAGNSEDESVPALSLQAFYARSSHLPGKDAAIVEAALEGLGYPVGGAAGLAEVMTDVETLGAQGFIDSLPQDMPVRTRASMTRFLREVGEVLERSMQQEGGYCLSPEDVHPQIGSDATDFADGASEDTQPPPFKMSLADFAHLESVEPNSPKPVRTGSGRGASKISIVEPYRSQSKMSAAAFCALEEVDPNSPKVIRKLSIAEPYRSQSKMSAAAFCSLEEVDPNSPKVIRRKSRGGSSDAGLFSIPVFAAPVQDSFTTADGAVEEEDCDPNSPKLMAGRRKSKRADPFGEQENQPQEEQAPTVNVNDFGMLDEIDPNSPKLLAGRRSKSKATSEWDAQPHEDEKAASSLQGMDSHSSPCDDAAEQANEWAWDHEHQPPEISPGTSEPGDEEPVTIRMRELPNEFIRRGSKEASGSTPTSEDGPAALVADGALEQLEPVRCSDDTDSNPGGSRYRRPASINTQPASINTQ